MYSEAAQYDAEHKLCPKCGQPLPRPDKYGVKVVSLGIRYRGKVTRLSLYQLRMFETLLRYAPEPVTRARLFQALYADARDGGPDGRPLDMLMWGLRQRLRHTGLQIETLYALGWRLIPPLGRLDG